ncbi:hypothetical protein [Pseudonocardia humida]|uniref:Excalibur calcium-binding domain-containing protein n=1 Tax=Pseudonocardia humida TaxID=2800819 RepID=A0ABT1A7E6_9PSEU|nr:hypothetical protein [Pseudonocardia humida]MCO1658942.1 hypothetical protein [Pseudonocardia humida]
MRLRTALAAVGIAVVATLLPSGVAAAASPLPQSCPDFATRSDAQAALDAHIVDADRLDPNHDGFACQSRLGEPATSNERATGDGGGAAVIAFVIGGLAVGGLGAGTLAQRARRAAL